MWPTQFLVVVLAFTLSVTGCGERAPAPFNAVDITGGDIGQSGRSLAGLRDRHGKPMLLSDLRGKVVMVYFGYTFCPDVCPTTLARLAEVTKALGADAARVRVLFITLDPERDTPDKLADYAGWYDRSFIGLSGDASATAAAARDFKVFFARNPGRDGSGYSIDHSGGVFVFDPAGRIRLYIKDSASGDAMAQDLKRLLAGQ